MTKIPLKTKILIVDDDPALRQLVAEYLNRHDFDALVAGDAHDLEQLITRFNPVLIVLDRMLPSGDGAQACRRLRESGEDIPIILLTAKDETVDRIIGLEAGADDYVCKPFDPRELLARIQAVLRRKSGASAITKQDIINFGPFCLNILTRSLTREGVPVHLTTGEFNLLEALVTNSGRPLSRDKLLTLMHDEEALERGDRAIDISILRLRRSLDDDPKQPQWIHTVWGIGYRFTALSDS